MLRFIFLILNIVESKERHRKHRRCEIIPTMPKCVPMCSSSSSSDSDSSSSDNRHNRDRYTSIRPQTEQYLQLIQGLLLQVNLNIEKYARWYSEELKQKLIGGVTLLNKKTAENIKNDICELEKKIIKILCHYNAEIGRELVELISNTNADLQDAVIQIIRQSSLTIGRALTDISVPPAAGATTGPTVDTTIGNELINAGIRTLMEELERLFRRVTAAEKGLANKIIEDKLHNQLRDIEKLLNDFEKKLENYFKDLGLETVALVTLNINNSTRRFIGYIEELIKKLGASVICILQGNNADVRQPVILNPSFFHDEPYNKD